MKRKVLLLGMCVGLALSMALGACGTNKNKAGALASAQDVYGMGAVSTVRLLGSGMPSAAVQTFAALNTTADVKTNDTDTESEVKAQAQKFNEYFAALDSFLGDDILTTSVTPNTDEAYPYETKMIINGKDFNGNTVLYTMYYTETLAATDTALDDEEDDEEDETERTYRLTGVMELNGIQYRLEGERKEESEKDEQEAELKIRAYADEADSTSYIEMEQEYSVEEGETETEYVYSVYRNGILVEQTAVEFETERKHDKVETEYELEFRSGEAKGKYTVERERKNDTVKMKVKYNIDGKSGVFHIREITVDGEKQYEYSFSDGYKQFFDQAA